MRVKRERLLSYNGVHSVYVKERETPQRERSGSLSNVSEERNLSYNVVRSVYVKERKMFKRDL